MANYGYIKLVQALSYDAAEALIREAVRACLDPRWQIEKLGIHWDWFVHLPGTEKRSTEADDAVLADGEPVGFTVELRRGTKNLCDRLAFRHGPNRFERWAQGCVEEQLADMLGVGVLYDATGDKRGPGSRWYRSGRTYREHLAACIGRPCDAGDEAWIETQMYCVPEGHRT